MKVLQLLGLAPLSLLLAYGGSGLALPPPEETPEEVLRTEIILEARSPLDGKPLTAAQYAQLQAQLAESPYPPELDSNVQELIFLLNVRKFLQILIPF